MCFIFTVLSEKSILSIIQEERKYPLHLPLKKSIEICEYKHLLNYVCQPSEEWLFPVFESCRIGRSDYSNPPFQERNVQFSLHSAQVFHYPLLWAQNKKVRIDFCVERKIPDLPWK